MTTPAEAVDFGLACVPRERRIEGLVLFLPVISAATSFGLLGTTISSLAACAMYLSFLLFLGKDEILLPEAVEELAEQNSQKGGEGGGIHGSAIRG